MLSSIHRIRPSVRTLLWVLVLLASASSTAAYAQIQTVVRKFDPAPIAGAQYKKFRSPVPGDANGGEIAFRATVKGDVGTKGIWREPGVGPGTQVVSKGDSGQGFLFRNFKRPVLNAAGETAWFAFVTPQGSGVFRGQGAGFKIVALEGSPSPVGGNYKRFFIPALSASGRVVFWASIDQGSSEEAILSCSGGDGDCNTGSGTLEILAKSGDAISDRPGREVCAFEGGLHASSWGMAFIAETKTDCANPAELAKDGVFRKKYTGGIETVALAGESSSLGGGFSVYTRFRDRPMIESSGNVVFRGSVSSTSNSDALFLCRASASCPGSPAEAIVEKGQDDMLGNTLRKISAARIDDAGDVCFHAKAKGPSAKGDAIYIRRAAGSLDRLVAKGNSVPDQPGATFRRIKLPFMTPAGRIAFKATVAGGAFSGPAQFLFEP